MLKWFSLRQLRPAHSLLVGVALLILSVMLVPIGRAYTAPGYQIAHDRAVPFMRVIAIKDAFGEGQFPPHWFSEFDGGYGSPYPSFYGMLFYQVAALLDSCCVSLGQSVELTAFLTMAVSGLAMFVLARRLWGTPSGLVSAGLYVYAPYHLVDAFVRGAYSELTAFVWFPLIVLFMLLWLEARHPIWILAGSISLAGLVLTHNIMPLVFLPSLPILGFAMLGHDTSKAGQRKTLAGWVMMAALGALLSAFFWIPIVADRQWIRTEYFVQFDYRDDFVGISQLLTTALQYSLTRELGIPLVIGASCGLLGVSLSERTRRTRRLITVVGLVSLGYIFMMNHRSDFLWSNIPLLPFVQWPWRFLAPITFFLSLTAGAVPAAITSRWWQWGLAIAFPLLAIQLHEPLIDMPQRIASDELEQIRICPEVWGTQDYRPRWSATAFWRSPQPPDPSEEVPVLAPCAGGIVMLPGDAGRLLETSIEGSTLTARYQAVDLAQLEFPQFYYPSWVVRVDGEPADAFPAPHTGLLRVEVPAGEHEVVASVGITGAQIIGLVLTGGGLALILAAAVMILSGRLTFDGRPMQR
jgi:hypothetical protein